MLKDQCNWSDDFVRMIWYMMNMAYYRKIGLRDYGNICGMCLTLSRVYGTRAEDYFVQGNNEYPTGNLMTLRPDVVSAIVGYDKEAYMSLVDGIMNYDAVWRILGRYSND